MSKQEIIYFASDFHLGIDAKHTSAERERMLVRWLDIVAEDADRLYLVGDLFDFWFEYKEVVPRGYFRFFAKLDQLIQQGIQLEIFTGNHDMWMFDYFEKELGVVIHRGSIRRTINGVNLEIGHGDGLGPGDYGYKFIKRIFANPVCQFLFARLHPNFALSMARFWSNTSRDKKSGKEVFTDPSKEWLVQHCEGVIDTDEVVYFIFGHRHLPLDITLSNGKSRYINLGDWINHYTYAKMEGNHIQLLTYSEEMHYAK